MNLAANLTLLYGHLPEIERFSSAADDGFEAVEILFPYQESPEWYAEQLRTNDLRLVLINTAITSDSGKMGLAAIPGQENTFRRVLSNAIEVARITGCETIHVMAGVVADLSANEWRQTLTDNLRWAIEQLASDKIVLTLEALSRTDVPGYAYYLPEQVSAIVRLLDSPRIRMQFDLYHAAKEGLDLPVELERALPYIRHIQIAGAPDRHEPDLARHRLLDCFSLLATHGYERWIGCEYRPRSTPREGLQWMQPLVQAGYLKRPRV